MRRARIQQESYADFMKQLTVAKREKRCLDPKLDRKAFEHEISKRDIKLTAFTSIVSSRYQAEEMYLITEGKEPWVGLFAIDRDTHACLRFVVEDA